MDYLGITIGFNYSVVEVEQGVPAQVCALIHPGSQRISSPIDFFLTYEDGTASEYVTKGKHVCDHYFLAVKGVHYVPIGGYFSSGFSSNCFSIVSRSFESTNKQARTFFMGLTKTSYSHYENVILSPQSVLIKIKERGMSTLLYI